MFCGRGELRSSLYLDGACEDEGRWADVTSESVQGSHTLGPCLKWLCRIFSKYRDVLSFNEPLLPPVP